jgi:hypothetical protein
VPCDSPPASTNNPLFPPEDDDQLPNQVLPRTPSDEDRWDDEDEDDEDEDLENTFESSSPGWEPPVSNDADNMSISSDNADSGLPPSSAPLEDLRERTWATPKVVKFPNPHAGEPVRSVDPTNNTYASLLRSDSDSNPYSPFASKVDWEVAKWAKLQGPSSTSLMDLLKIEGVMMFRPNG